MHRFPTAWTAISGGGAMTPSGMRAIRRGVALFRRCDARQRLRRAVVRRLQGREGGWRVPRCARKSRRLGSDRGCTGRREALARHYRPTVTLWGIVDLRCNPLVVLLLTGRWLVGSSLRLTALRS